MKLFKICLTLFFLLIFLSPASAQEWVRQHPFDVISRIYDADISNEGFGWAVGSDGVILYTENAGSIWSLQETPFDEYPLRDVAYVDGTNGQKAFAGGNIFYKTENGGQTWEQVMTGISIPTILDIDVLSEDVILVCGSGGLIRSEDGGDTWEELGDFSGVYNSMHWTDVQTGYLHSSTDVHKTTDGGQTWNLIYSITGQFLETIEFLDANTGYLQGADNIYKTTDAGASWVQINTDPLVYSANDFHLVDENEMWVSFNNGAYFGAKSIDGGVTWTILQTNDVSFAGRSYGVFGNDNGIWVLGELTRIGFSDDGTNFVDQIPGNKNTLLKTQFLNDQAGLAVGNDGIMLRTNNGGMIWEELIYDVDNNATVFDVTILNASNIWITATFGVYKTSDQGDNWTKMSDESARVIHALPNGDLIIAPANNPVKRSTDGGATWTEVYSDPNVFFTPMHITFSDDVTGWITGTNGVLLKTIDAGLTWTKEVPPVDENLGTLDFLTPDIGWLVPTHFQDTIWRTDDGGANWSPLKIGSNTFWRTAVFQDEQTGWVAGGSSGSGKIYKTTDGGQTWELDHSDVVIYLDMALPVPGEPIVYAVGGGGSIMKLAPCEDIPVLESLTGDMTPCAGDTVQYEVLGTDIAEYDWNIPSDWNFFGNTNTSLISLIVGTESGQITIQGSNTCEESNILSLDVDPGIRPDVPEISFDGLTLTTTAIADTYQWYRDGGVSSDDASFIPTISGTYNLEVTSDGCTSELSESIDVIVTSSQEIHIEPLRIFPNPGSGLFNIENEVESGELMVSVSDITGTVVYKDQLFNPQLDISHLVPGLYFVHLRSETQNYLGKVVIK